MTSIIFSHGRLVKRKHILIHIILKKYELQLRLYLRKIVYDIEVGRSISPLFENGFYDVNFFFPLEKKRIEY